MRCGPSSFDRWPVPIVPQRSHSLSSPSFCYVLHTAVCMQTQVSVITSGVGRKHNQLYKLGAIQLLRNAMGVGRVSFPRKRHYKGVRFKISWKKALRNT